MNRAAKHVKNDRYFNIIGMALVNASILYENIHGCYDNKAFPKIYCGEIFETEIRRESFERKTL